MLTWFKKWWCLVWNGECPLDKVNAAVLAEREACAKTVENFGHKGGRIRASHRYAARAIRERTQPSGAAYEDAVIREWLDYGYNGMPS